MNKPARRRILPMTDADYRRAIESGEKMAASPLRVTRVRYDANTDSLELRLRGGVMVALPRKQIWELARAKPAQLRRIEIQPGGDAISFPSIDVDIYVPGLLADELGSLFAKAMGRRSRGRTSPKKAAASRANGRKGGRPKKTAA